jgi:hypothetical protein
MLCVSPVQRFITETMQCLGFGSRARQVARGQVKKRRGTVAPLHQSIGKYMFNSLCSYAHQNALENARKSCDILGIKGWPKTTGGQRGKSLEMRLTRKMLISQ